MGTEPQPCRQKSPPPPGTPLEFHSAQALFFQRELELLIGKAIAEEDIPEFDPFAEIRDMVSRAKMQGILRWASNETPVDRGPNVGLG